MWDALPSKRIAGALVQHFPWCAKWSLVSITVSGEDDTEIELDPEECLALRTFLDDALRMHAEAERADAAERAADEKPANQAASGCLCLTQNGTVVQRSAGCPIHGGTRT